jgi:hypothetical protein
MESPLLRAFCHSNESHQNNPPIKVGSQLQITSSRLVCGAPWRVADAVFDIQRFHPQSLKAAANVGGGD